jgi:NMD protein affecting ribosome stability and mRNA decay
MRRAGVSVDYVCEQCGRSAALCVSDWGYIAALCEDCMRDRKSYLKLPGRERRESGPPPADRGAAA